MLCAYTPCMPTFSELVTQAQSDDSYGLALHNSTNSYDFMFSLVRARKDAGLKQADVAENMGVTQQAVSRIEAMDGDPALSTLRRYATAIGVALDLKIDEKSHWFKTESSVRAAQEPVMSVHEVLRSTPAFHKFLTTTPPVLRAAARSNHRDDFGLAG